ncbi:unnamed protein product [Phyllotreta striolata]|uniref:Glutathione S-transferase n=1 Tax=Phyllotreta striolata TaxID=444603 RepID=A0A9N9TY94_PHYSR|nr:unnamed protein product [Phyllotreta striolata]
MPSTDKFQLVLFEGDFALPAIEPESIKSILYCKIAEAPVTVRLFNSYRNCALYKTPPLLLHDKVTCTDSEQIVAYLKCNNFNIDRELDPKQRSECLALKNLVQSKLKPAVEFNYWIEHRNSTEFLNIWFMKCLPIPLNYFYTGNFRNRAVDLMESLYPNETDKDVIKEYIQRAAIDCLQSLSSRLGNGEFFYGSKPTTLDVAVYSYVAPFIKIPFPLNEMYNVVNMWPNLVNLVKRIDNLYFPNVPKGSKYIRLEDKAKTTDDEVSYAAIVILTLSATSLILGFAYKNGYLTGKIPD